MAVTPRTLLKHELIGLDAEVVESTNKSLIGIKGKVMMETKNTLTIGSKMVPKKGSVFVFAVKGSRIKVDGEKLIARPEERIRKKIKKW